jgi:beta-lactamase regulating signal transducer with metallopeptidase domain
MTSLGIALTTAAVQVTLAAAAALGIVALAGRRNSRTAATLAATALGLSVLLTLAAAAPTPHWWSWDSVTPMVDIAPTVSEQSDLAPETNQSGGLMRSFRRFLAVLPVAESKLANPESQWSVWSIVVAVFFVGSAIDLARLASGLVVIAAIRRRSTPIVDPGLTTETDDLQQALGIRAAISLRQSSEIGTGATIGWHRPVILLAADWPCWNASERRAILAHELAHVRRRDYLVSLLAAIARCVHFYHPLIRWLVARLRLHQEMAADVLAATVGGDRAAYLQTLARMALRQDAVIMAGVARPFLSDRNSLLRRIAMLRVTEDNRTVSQAARWGLASLLIGAALCASAVRGPAQQPAAATAVDVPPFDISHVPANSNMLFAFRPAAILAKPGMKPLADRYNRVIANAMKDAGLAPEIKFSVEEIEQIVMAGRGMKASPPPGREWRADEPQNMLTEASILVRMTHDVDWLAMIRAVAATFGGEVREIRPGIFRVADDTVIYVQVIDRRTICIPGQAHPTSHNDLDAALAELRPAANPAAAWGPAWEKVRRAGVALALENRTGYWTDYSGPIKEWTAVMRAIGRPSHVIGSLDLADTVTAHLYATVDDTTSDPKRANLDAVAVAMTDGLGEVNDGGKDHKLTARRIMLELLKGRSIQRVDNMDIAEFHSAAKLAEFLTNVDFPFVAEQRTP